MFDTNTTPLSSPLILIVSFFPFISPPNLDYLTDNNNIINCDNYSTRREHHTLQLAVTFEGINSVERASRLSTATTLLCLVKRRSYVADAAARDREAVLHSSQNFFRSIPKWRSHKGGGACGPYICHLALPVRSRWKAKLLLTLYLLFVQSEIIISWIQRGKSYHLR